MNKLTKTAKAGYLTVSLLLCLIGIAFIAVPSISAKVLSVSFGIVLITFGVFKIIGYYSKDLFRLVFQFDFALGILLILVGNLFIFTPYNILNLLSVCGGIYILLDGLLKIQIAMDAKRFGLNTWWLIMLLAVLTGIFSLILIFHPSSSIKIITSLIGVAMIFEGVLNFITAITSINSSKQSTPEDNIIDVEYIEIDK